MFEMGTVVAVIIALSELIKRNQYVSAKYIPLFTMAVGIVAGIVYIPHTTIAEGIMNGIIAGLTSNGVYSLGKGVITAGKEKDAD
ncbi:phage holin family protein [Paenibacillus sp. 1P03SA]|uniref:phage holin family protein n=1 Tax=Paenibacillus sp. 1P03SA TaxID=3132294 RepID=UPI0039A1236B